MKSNPKEYQSATQNRKSCVPGSANIKKILQFIKAHLQKLVSSLWSTCMVTALPCMITERCSFWFNKGWTSPVPMKCILCQILKIPPILNRSMRHQLPQKRATSSARSFSTTCEHKENV